jgi:aspartate kinase
MGDINVEMISMGANEINLSLVVQYQQRTEALRRLHRALIESPSPANAGVVRP